VDSRLFGLLLQIRGRLGGGMSRRRNECTEGEEKENGEEDEGEDPERVEREGEPGGC
jgi:hypothetical protein